MSSAHLDALRIRHDDLETRIHQEETRPAADSLAIADLKKRKLALKDRMAASGTAEPARG